MQPPGSFYTTYTPKLYLQDAITSQIATFEAWTDQTTMNCNVQSYHADLDTATSTIDDVTGLSFVCIQPCTEITVTTDVIRTYSFYLYVNTEGVDSNNRNSTLMTI